MIKKTLILAALAAFTLNGAIAADAITTPASTPAAQTQQAAPAETPTVKTDKAQFDAPPPPPCKKREKANAEFEKRLKLTDEQKAKAKELRLKGHEQMEPIIAKIKDLKQEKDMVLKSRMAVQMQQEKIAEIDAQIKDLKKQARELRIQNMKEFESILCHQQKKELQKMKKEGRKKFEKARKKCIKEGNCKPMQQPAPMPKPASPIEE